MTYEFCTLFDRAYLPRALVLHRSLAEHAGDFRLRAFCMDDPTYELLSRLDPERVEAIRVGELERHDPDLLAVKPTRTALEYYWTATPAVSLYCLEREPDLESITYLDADLMFFSSPQPIYDELADASVLIVPHRFGPRWVADVATSGVYNVQFMTFRRRADGLEALRWWRERCLEWCYARVEDGKFGDQKYLDDWPERFRGVHVLEHVGAGLAPWNAARYRLEPGSPPTVDGRPLVFFHYHSLRLHSGLDALARLRALPRPYHRAGGSHPLVWSAGYPIAPDERELVWEPYVTSLGEVIEEARRADPSLDVGLVHDRAWRVVLRPPARLARRIRARLDPDRVPAIGLRRHRRSWQSASVAAQMAALTDEELRDPGAVAPFRTFLEATGVLVGEYPLGRPSRFLDFGCGTGQYSELLERSFPGRFAYVGCDYAAELVVVARERWPGREFVVNDVFDNRLDLDSFEVICASALIDVLPEWERALDTLLVARSPYVLLHRQRIVDGPAEVEVAPGYEGQKTHRVRLGRSDVEAAASRHGRAIERSFHVAGEIESFLLVRSTGA